MDKSLRELDVFLFSEFINTLSILYYNFWIHYTVMHFFSNFVYSVQTIYHLVSFQIVLHTFTCVGDFVNLWSIFFQINILISFPCVCCYIGTFFSFKTSNNFLSSFKKCICVFTSQFFLFSVVIFVLLF